MATSIDFEKLAADLRGDALVGFNWADPQGDEAEDELAKAGASKRGTKVAESKRGATKISASKRGNIKISASKRGPKISASMRGVVKIGCLPSA